MSTENPYQSPQTESLATEQQADGLSTRGMWWLLFSFQGRMPRSSFWGISLVLLFAQFALKSATVALFELATAFGRDSLPLAAASIAIPMVAMASMVGVVWISAAIHVKR